MTNQLGYMTKFIGRYIKKLGRQANKQMRK